jgi:hypothetical protein
MKLRTLTIWSLLLISFMEKELASGGINTLVIRVDYNYAFLSYPNLRDKNPLTEEDVKRLVSTAQTLGISIIPQINLLGHLSLHSPMENLLTVYPEFDENPSSENARIAGLSKLYLSVRAL